MAGNAHAIGLPAFDALGPFADPTFNGSGINGPSPNIATTEITHGLNTLTLGLAATRRFSENPAVTDDGNGTYSATTGVAIPASDPNGLQGTTWNFNYYLDVSSTGGGALADYDVFISYDFNPATPVVPSGTGTIFIPGFAFTPLALAGTPIDHGSQNLLFSFFGTSGSGITAPDDPLDPNAEGLYSFSIDAFATGTTASLGSDAINVDVSTVPLSAGLPLLAVGLGAFAVIRRRKAS